LGELSLPDPRLLDDATRLTLAEQFRRVAERPAADTIGELERPERQALDETVFDLIGLPVAERAAAREALIECLEVRRRRARRACAGVDET
jgi:hypothetical protein